MDLVLGLLHYREIRLKKIEGNGNWITEVAH